MNIQDTVYIVNQSTIFDVSIKNSVSIYKAEIVAIKAKVITVKFEIDADTTTFIIQQIDSDKLYTTPQQALERANTLIITKDVKDEPNSTQQG